MYNLSGLKGKIVGSFNLPFDSFSVHAHCPTESEAFVLPSLQCSAHSYFQYLKYLLEGNLAVQS